MLFGSISSRPIHFMKAGMLLHLLGSTDCVTTKKTAYWDSFESRSRIFILTKFDRFWRNSEICPIFQWPIAFSSFGICLNDYGYLIVMFSAIYTWKIKTKALKLTKLLNFWSCTFFLCHPVCFGTPNAQMGYTEAKCLKFYGM